MLEGEMTYFLRGLLLEWWCRLKELGIDRMSIKISGEVGLGWIEYIGRVSLWGWGLIGLG